MDYYLNYSFKLPFKISLIKYFLPAKNNKITGIQQITEYDISLPHSVISLKLPLKLAKPMGKVLIESELVIIKGHIKLFQVVIKVNIPSVIIAGIARSNAILKNALNILHPSSFAASSKSFGKDLNHCLIKNTPKPPNNPGIINAW